jgi:hypothetical protein
MRSRYVQVSGRENDVLMDENLLESKIMVIVIVIRYVLIDLDGKQV